MFVNCPHCGGLVATDPATDRPPERCPRCAVPLREADAAAAAPVAPDAPAAPARATAQDAAVHVPEALATPAPAVVVPPASLQQVPIAVALRIDTTPAAPAAPAVDAPVDAPARVEAGSAPEAAVDTTLSLVADTTPAVALDVVPDADPMPGPAPAVAPAPAPPPATPATNAPTFARGRARTPRRGGWALPAVAAALVALLGLQWLLADRARLAQDARWRPVVLRACGLLRCAVPAWREPAAFTVVDRDVRPHPTRPGVLRVSATFRNDARWAQAWPLLQLTLSDVDGRIEGLRAFTVDDYLAAAPTQDGIAAGQLASVRMDVVEPSPRVVSFAFDFR